VTWIRRIAVAGTLVCLLTLPCTPAMAGSAERKAVKKINQERAEAGLRPLRVSGSLNRSSRRYVNVMRRRGYFGHSSRLMISTRFRKRGEVLATTRGRRPRPGVAVSLWMRSPVHRRLLLDGGFRYIGLARAFGSFGGPAITGWVAQLGA
jgi:uncharacterized protein YkwD